MMTGLNNITGKEFPAWEQSVSSVDTGRSQRGNGVNTTVDVREMQGRSTLVGAWLRCVVMLLLMVVGVGEMWGQLDYSGTYYIRSESTQKETPGADYYLCPTQAWCSYKLTDDDEPVEVVEAGDNQPFLTTERCKTNNYAPGAANAVWIIEKAPNSDYYYIKHKSDNKYLVSNGNIKTCPNPDRLRVHLETVSDLVALGNKVLFDITPYDTYLVISPKGITDTDSDAPSGHAANHGTHKWLSINQGNKNGLKGTGARTDGPTDPSGYKNTGGLVGLYTQGDANAKFYLEDVDARPTITYSSFNNVTISYPESATIYYTTDGSDPTTSSTKTEFTGTSQSVTITNTNCTVVKAVAVIGNGFSNIATYIFVQTGSTNPYLIQSVENTNFYMTVGDVASSKTTVNTSSLPQAGMSWYFENAGTVDGVQYFKVCNTSGGYLRRDGNSFYISSAYEDKADYKFAVTPYYESGTIAGFNLYNIGKTQFVYKAEGNGANNPVNLSTNGTQQQARWNLILVANKDFPSLVTLSDNTSATYYTFTSSNQTTYLITTPTGTAVNVTTSNGENDSQKWYFENAGDDGWATYYYIRNAVTGEAIYFNGTEVSTTQESAFIMKSLSEKTEENAKNYCFTLAKTITDGEYYIVPKPLAQFTKTNYNAIWRGGTYALQTQSNRANNMIKWQISKVDNFVPSPYISYVETTNTATITCTYPGATIYYTTDESEATTSSTNTAAPVDPSPTASISFPLDAGVSTIRAIVSKDGIGSSSESTYSIKFQLTLSDAESDLRPYLIQSQANTYFYMIPGDDEGEDPNKITKVNTTSLFRPSMEWYFKNAGIVNGVQYYYIVNKGNNKNLCYDTENTANGVYMDTNSDNSNKFKFQIKESPTAGTFDIIPYGCTTGNMYINKYGGNSDYRNLGLHSGANDATSRWKFVLKSTLDKSAPFDVPEANSMPYYKIESVGSSGYYIVPPTGNNVNTTTSNSNDANVVKSGIWYFEVAYPETNEDWCTYYHIRNAKTGEYLYFNKDGNNAGACLEMKDAIESGQEDRYQFTWAKTADANANYYIIPKLLKDASMNNFSTLQRNNGTLQSNLTRGANNYAWKFTDALFCNNPVFDATGEKIIISCNTNASEIFYTEDGSDPDPESTQYTSSSDLSASEQKLIKAIAIYGTTQSEIVTLLNKPDITSELEDDVTYNGTAWEPEVIEVSISSGTDIIIAPTSPVTYSVTYTNNTDAGEASIVVNDANAYDTWYILNATKAFTINRAEATVKADDKTKVYQTPNLDDPTLTATITGLVNNEPESNIAYAISRENGEDAGLYIITPTGDAEQGNYHVTYETGIFQIGKEMSSAPTVSLANWNYGSPNEPSVSGNESGGDVTYYYKVKDAGDDTYTEEVPRNVGDYTIKAEIARTDEYFPATTAAVNFKINKASLTVVADPITKDYLDEDPELTYTVTGIQYNEDRSTIIACELQRATGEAKGNYNITQKSLRLLSTQNYNNPTFQGNTFTITAKNLGDPVTLEPASGISIYAKDNGDNSWTVSVYTGKNAFVSGTDYTYSVTGPDEGGNYTVTVTAVENSNCRGSAKGTYSPTTFYAIYGATEQFIPYISTTSDLTTSSDLVPYIVSQVNSSLGTVSIVPISYIPKDEPVLLLAKSDVTGITTSPKNPATPPISESLINSNLLNIAPDELSDPSNQESAHGVPVKDTEAYIFYNGEFVLTKEGVIKPDYFFLYNPNYKATPEQSGGSNPAPRRTLQIVIEERVETGMAELRNDELTESRTGIGWYTIDGRRLNGKPRAKGLYIVDGKKVMVK